MSKVRIVAKEGGVVEVDLIIASMSTTIMEFIKARGDDIDFPLPEVRLIVLHKIIEFCTYSM